MSSAYGDTTSSIALVLDSPDRPELPHVDSAGTIYWVGTGRMTPFIQRLLNAEDDGLTPADYPVDTELAVVRNTKPASASIASASSPVR
jgi:hypothetical protein